MEFVEHEIEHNKQVTNNSLWSYRYFIIAKTKEFTHELVQNELQYALKQLIEKDSTNEAAWVYLKGYLAQTREEQAQTNAKGNIKRWYIGDFPEVKERLLKLIDEKEEFKANRFLYSTLLDFATAEKNWSQALDYL